MNLDFEATVKRGKAEIVEDVLAGIVSCDVKDFSGLHDFVDANGYGGAFDAWYEGCTDCDEFVGFWSRVQDALSAWISSGAMRCEAAMEERRREQMLRKKWEREFSRDYAVPTEVEALVAEGLLADESWHNDACPRFTAAGGVDIWVEHPDQSMRESGGQIRFVAVDEDGGILLQTDAVSELVAWARRREQTPGR